MVHVNVKCQLRKWYYYKNLKTDFQNHKFIFKRTTVTKFALAVLITIAANVIWNFVMKPNAKYQVRLGTIVTGIIIKTSVTMNKK